MNPLENESNSRSATRYIAFAEQGAGLPGLLSIHSLIHSARDKAGSGIDTRLDPRVWFEHSEDEGRLSAGELLKPEDAVKKEEERGAKTTLSV